MDNKIDRTRLTIGICFILVFILLVYISYGRYYGENEKEEINIVRIHANNEYWNCTIIRNDSYDLCISDSNKEGYIGELV